MDTLKDKLLNEFGFQARHVDKALLLTQQEEQAVELIVGFLEDEEKPADLETGLEQALQMAQEEMEEGEEEPEDDVKMVFVVRKELKMKTGKIAAQVGHAVLKAYKQVACQTTGHQVQMLQRWEEEGEKKIVLSIPGGEEQLLALVTQAREQGVNVCYIRDAGHTQVEPNSLTVAAFGPDLSSTLHGLTGNLKLV